MTNFIRSMFTPQETTMADVITFYVLVVSRFMPEWTAILCSLPA
jgi:hypothetical protein